MTKTPKSSSRAGVRASSSCVHPGGDHLVVGSSAHHDRRFWDVAPGMMPAPGDHTVMGYLTYEHGAAEMRCEDRVLAHVQIVVINKLRRREAFAFSWTEPPQAGSGRSTIWLHPAVNLRFRFTSSRPIAINAAWVGLLAQAAESRPGLRLLPEPDEELSGIPRDGKG